MKDSFIGYLDLSSWLRMSDQSKLVDDIELEVEFLEFRIVELSTIICDYYLR